MKKFQKVRNYFLECSLRAYILINNKNVNIVLVLAIFTIIFFTSDAQAQGFNGRKYGQVCQKVLQLVEGAFGSMLTAAAGVGALVASAVGGFKMAWSLVVVAIGSFTLRTYQELWFASCQ